MMPELDLLPYGFTGPVSFLGIRKILIYDRFRHVSNFVLPVWSAVYCFYQAAFIYICRQYPVASEGRQLIKYHGNRIRFCSV